MKTDATPLLTLLLAWVCVHPMHLMAQGESPARPEAGQTTTIKTGPGVPNQKCKDGATPDNANRVLGKEWCLAAYTYLPPTPIKDAPIVVVLHGDGGGRTSANYPKAAEKIARELGVIAVSVLRPGYQDGEKSSEGFAKRQDDDYTKENIDSVAGALLNLKAAYPDRKLIVTGLSGGAAISALIIATHPGVAVGAVLGGCPCDIDPWRRHRNAQRGNRGGASWSSLSPLAYAEKTPKDAIMIAVSGDKDENTLPIFAERYVTKLKSLGVAHAEQIIAPGATHTGTLNAPEYYSAVQKIVQMTSKGP